MISICVFKIFELCLVPVLRGCINLSSCQLGLQGECINSVGKMISKREQIGEQHFVRIFGLRKVNIQAYADDTTFFVAQPPQV